MTLSVKYGASVSDIMQAEKSWVSLLRNQKLATKGQGTLGI